MEKEIEKLEAKLDKEQDKENPNKTIVLDLEKKIADEQAKY